MTTAALFDRYYYSRSQFVDGTTKFHRACAHATPSPARILEIGAGPSNPTSDYLASLGDLIAVDISPEVHTNRAVKAAIVYDGRSIPLASRQFDVCVSDFVLEHIEDPHTHFREVARILRPGGLYCFRTPNLWHYVTLVAKATPHSIHRLLANRLRGLPTEAHDPYPTFYRANTRSAITACLNTGHWSDIALEFIEPEPSYGRISPVAFYPMLAYERIVNRFAFLAPFRVNILGWMRTVPNVRQVPLG